MFHQYFSARPKGLQWVGAKATEKGSKKEGGLVFLTYFSIARRAICIRS
jgi:hypothetical protein